MQIIIQPKQTYKLGGKNAPDVKFFRRKYTCHNTYIMTFSISVSRVLLIFFQYNYKVDDAGICNLLFKGPLFCIGGDVKRLNCDFLGDREYTFTAEGIGVYSVI